MPVIRERVDTAPEKRGKFMYRKMKYRRLSVSEIQPEGWFYRQLKTQAEGLCGNLDKVWPDVRESRWVGGDREGWERVPYWLDGFIPMAWLLRDENLQKRAVKYIDAVLAQQKKDGWICPCEDEERPTYDVWAAFLICKVLVVYYECTEDSRIEEAVYGAMKCLNLHMEKYTLFNWGASRWFECLIPLGWLYERRPEDWMRELALKLRIQGIDYEALFESWPYKKPQEQGRWSYITHVVNMAMCLKADALNSAFWGKEAGGFARKALDMLMKYHGMPGGHFSGDECLAGKNPLRGTELCGVVEAMYSYEWLFQMTGEDCWAERLEALAYNVLPAAVSTDMWSHQYDQMPNQAECSRLSREKNHFGTNGGESHLFGLEPNFGCCTANFGQGWPKLAFSGILKTESGLATGAIFPCCAKTKIENAEVLCRIDTEYPFEDAYRVIVQTDIPVEFELSLRIPDGAVSALADGKLVKGKRYIIRRKWQGREEITVGFTFKPELVPQYEDMYYVKRGPLVYCVPIEAERKLLEYTRDGVERKYPYCDYELFPKSAWNYAFADTEFVFIKRKVGKNAFDTANPPTGLRAKLCPVEWPLQDGLVTVKPVSNKPVAEETKVELAPYGCTDLRMTVMPVVNTAK